MPFTNASISELCDTVTDDPSWPPTGADSPWTSEVDASYFDGWREPAFSWEEQIKASLDSVGMWEHRDNRIGSLSGGQKQRAVIARMFASDPDIFVLDEPTTGMDAGSKNEFYELMHHSAHHHGKAVLMITHDPEEVKDYADRNIHLVRNQDSPWRCFNVHENDQEVGHA